MTRSGIVAGLVALAAGLEAAPVRADCAWDIGLAEEELQLVERAAPLAGDPTLGLGPPGERQAFVAGGADPLAERAATQAFPSADGESASAGGEAVERQLALGRTFLDRARRAQARGERELCYNAVSRAREALAEARAAFRAPR